MAVIYTGIIRNGVVTLPAGVVLAEGAMVLFEPLETGPAPTLGELLQDLDGMATDLPTDLAANLDHYVHGHARP